MDELRAFVEKMSDGKQKCKFCGQVFSGTTSITRFKWHWSKVERQGAKPCAQVTTEVQEAALQSVRQAPDKRRKIMSSSRNTNEFIQAIPTTQEEINEVGILVGDQGMMQMEGYVMEGGAFSQQGEALSPGAQAWMDGLINDDTWSIAHLMRVDVENGDESREDAQQATDRVGQGALEEEKASLSSAEAAGNQMENMIPGMTKPIDRSFSPERLIVAADEPRGDPQQQNNEMDNLAGDEGRTQKEVQGTEQVEPHKDSSQSTDPLCLGLGRHYGQICSSSVNNDVIMNDVENMMRGPRQHVLRGSSHERLPVNQDEPMNDEENMVRVPGEPVMRDSSDEGLHHNGDERSGDAIPTKKLVGGEFVKNEKAIWSWLMNDEVSSIGVYGMGGVGKTTLLKHIYNQLLERPDTSHHVYWVTVSRDFNVHRLQNLIAKCLDLDLSNENDELRRAVRLSKELKKKQKWVLILDDLWNSFELDKVGIPDPMEGCKLILTTRDLKVCRRMSCLHKIKVQVLSEEEAWTLFMEKLAHDVILSPEVELIAKDVMRECAGLPLGIITMAGSMRGVDDLHEWSNTLDKLKQSKFRDMEDEVFGVLKHSYDRLNDFALQQCLLYCALFPEDYEIRRERLIGYLIDEGIIEGMNSREAEFDEGHTMLNKLENFCLLESCNAKRAVKIHDLIRDMAHQILQTNSQVMVGDELPDVDKWKEDLVRVSFLQGCLEEIPSSHSPRCPSLSTLLLCGNQKLRFITDSFFKELRGLKVLDLSYTSIENLPDSFSDLVSLNALLLEGCLKLRHVPSLKKLKSLKRLDLFHTPLEKMPQGLECLTNLRYLRLNGCGEREFPSGILLRLPNLRVFILKDHMPWFSIHGYYLPGRYAPVTVKGMEVTCLRKLETLECHFEGYSDYLEYLKSQDEFQSLRSYKFFVGQINVGKTNLMNEIVRNKVVWLGSLSINRDGDFQVMFPNDVGQLLISNCNDARSLCDVLSLKSATKLEIFNIVNCNSMESLFSSSWFCSAPPPSPSNGIFSSLKKFYCGGCPRMKKLFPPVLLPNLVNLKDILVQDCEKMEEIIARGDEEGAMGEEFSLPKLKSLTLEGLPELKSICSAKLICDSLEEITVWDCPELKRMPFCLSLLGNGQPSPPRWQWPAIRVYARPKEWWETVVEREHPSPTYVPTVSNFIEEAMRRIRIKGGLGA